MLENKQKNEKRTARSYDIYGIACGIGSIIVPFLSIPMICLAFFLALAAIFLGYKAIQENQKIGGIASIVTGLVGIILHCLIVYGLMSY